MNESMLNVCEGINIIEWELASRICDRRIPLANTLGFSTTLLPYFVFTRGCRRPAAGTSAAYVGLGYAYNFINSQPKRASGMLQRLGAAGLLVRLYGDSPFGPLISVGIWHLLSIYMANDPNAPYKSVAGTGQTVLDRKLIGADHMLNPDYDPDGIMTTLMTSVSMWFGQWYSGAAVSSNDSFVTGLSMMSLGYLCCYTFPQLYPFSQTFWTFSYALGNSGYSLLKMTGTRMICRALASYSIGHRVLWYLNLMGSKTIYLFFISAIIDQTGATEKVESISKGYKGKIIASLFKNASLFVSALALNRLFI